MVNDKEFSDRLHIEIHSLRLIPNYKPSPFELKVSSMISEKFSNTCPECKKRTEIKSNNPKETKKGFFGLIGDALNDDS